MINSIFITGGAASGKSRWAITRLSTYDDVLYMCTRDSIDSYTNNRINYGTDIYGVGWEIKTGVKDNPLAHIGNHMFVIFDSLEDYTETTIKRMCPDISKINDDIRQQIKKQVISDIEVLQNHIRELGGCMIVPSLEVGFSLKPDDQFQKEFRGILGSINQRVANIFDEVYFSVSGIQFKIKPWVTQ